MLPTVKKYSIIDPSIHDFSADVFLMESIDPDGNTKYIASTYIYAPRRGDQMFERIQSYMQSLSNWMQMPVTHRY